MKIGILLLILVSFNAWSQDRLRLAFSTSQTRQGALVRAKLIVLPEQINLPVQKLKGTSVADTLYFHQISPLLRKDGSETYESEVQVIFVKVPEDNSVTGMAGTQPFTLEWDRLEVIPVEAPEQMLWADFSAPDFIEANLKWIWAILIALPLLFGGYIFRQRFRKKKRLKEKRRSLVMELRNCKSYEEVVSLWQKKRTYLKEFPQLEEHFRELEIILFKYQFKPTQTDYEKSEVMTAYRKLLDNSEGGLRGI